MGTSTSVLSVLQSGLSPGVLISVIGVVVGVLSVLVTVYFYRKRTDVREEVLLAEVYESGVDEVTAFLEEDVYPGTVTDRASNSFASDISRMQRVLLDDELHLCIDRYHELLKRLEMAEAELESVVPRIEDRFPDVLTRSNRTSLSLLVMGVTGDQLDVERTGQNSPEVMSFTTEMPFEVLFGSVDLAVLNADSVDEVRSALVDREPGDDEFDLDKAVVQRDCDELTALRVRFLDENFPKWDETVFELIQEGVVKEYLEAKKREEVFQEDLEFAAESVRDLILERYSE